MIETNSEPALPALLRELRSESGFSLRGLAAKSKIPHSYISNIEQGRRPVGQDAAGKLADAFELKGNKREQFLLAAAQASPRDKILGTAKQLPAKVLNAFALKVIQELAREHDVIEVRSPIENPSNKIDARLIQHEMAEELSDTPAMPAKNTKQGKKPRIARCFINFPAESLPESALGKLRKQGSTKRRVFDLAIQLASGRWFLWEFKSTRL